MTKHWNSSLEQRTPLKARKPLKTKKGLKSHKRLRPVSDKQKAKNDHWREVTDERCYELGFICQWCGKPGQRNDPAGFYYLNGHHIIKRRHNIHTKKNCYIVHQFGCHGEIEDNNINVLEYPTREDWLRSRKQ